MHEAVYEVEEERVVEVLQLLLDHGGLLNAQVRSSPGGCGVQGTGEVQSRGAGYRAQSTGYRGVSPINAHVRTTPGYRA